MQVLDAASQTFTLLSDELQREEEEEKEELRQTHPESLNSLTDRRRSHLETKWLWSGEKATFRTQEPWPLSVAARLACCLQHNKTQPQRVPLDFRTSQNAEVLWLNSHVVDLDVAVVRGCDQQLRVGGEGERPDGHGVTCRTGEGHSHTHTLQ